MGNYTLFIQALHHPLQTLARCDGQMVTPGRNSQGLLPAAFDFPQDQAASISPILFVTPDDPPTLLIHGDADTLVPISASEIMYAALQAESVESEFITIAGGDHGFRNQEHRAQAQAAMAAWFAGHLAPGGGH